MKKHFTLCLLLACSTFLFSCNRDNKPDNPVTPDDPVNPSENTVTDIDGNVYNTILIGEQCWMKENLRTTRFADGTPIPIGDEENWSDSEPFYYDYGISGIPLEERGYLYNWPAAVHGTSFSKDDPSDVQGICPNGWHLPSDAEWKQLTDYVSSHSEYVCGDDTNNIAKALASTTWWHNESRSACHVGADPGSNNASGFCAIPAGGWLGSIEECSQAGYTANFWSSTESNNYSDCACIRELDYYHPDVFKFEFRKRLGFSVRCLRD